MRLLGTALALCLLSGEAIAGRGGGMADSLWVWLGIGGLAVLAPLLRTVLPMLTLAMVVLSMAGCVYQVGQIALR